ncbi:OB-fold putative lipoprotein [Polaribacter sp.]|nr:OB-fold putative lipoprotein [Polaribacter sp.]
MKKITIYILIIGLLSIFIGYTMYHKPHINVAKKPVDIAITANILFADFSSDEKKANTKYLDKIIAVKGKVANVAFNGEKATISLQTEDDFGSVVCYLVQDELMKSTEIKEGQEVILKGICTGFLMDVILVKCVVMNSK